MRQLLETLETLLIRINAPLLYSLNEGLGANKVKNIEVANGFELPAEIEDIYMWKNGSHADYDLKVGSRYLLDREILMPLAKVFAEYNYSISHELEYYSKAYFPLFESMGEEFLVIDCNPKSDTFKMILSYQTKHVFMTEGAVPVYDTPQTMIQSITKCFSEKAYYYEKINRFEVDFELEDEINTLLNPKTKYLKSHLPGK